ncbi:MAG: DUF4115 domain-containing protein [Rhodospirillales bacterium]|nr:DUF4115 domain-containing protein [Rhodospirillales bacterium]
MSENESPDFSKGATTELNAAELGGMLRETRSAFKRELSDVAAELRIRLVYLEAIEEGRLDRLPGPAYASGFVRAYGDYLGLDGEDLVSKFKLAGGVGGGRMDLQLPSPVEEGRLPTGSILLVAAVLAFGAYGGWYYLSSQGRDPMKFVASLPEHLVSLIGAGDSDKPESKTGSAQIEKPAATEPPQNAEQMKDAPERPHATVAVAEESLNQENTGETKIVEKVEAVTVAAAEPVVPHTPVDSQRKSVTPPSSLRPALPVTPPKLPPALTDLPAPGSSDAIEKPKLASRPDSVPVIPGISAGNPGNQPDPSAADNGSVSEDRNSETAAAKVAVNTPSAQPPSVVPTAEISRPAATQDANSHRVVVRATADSWVEVRSGDEDPMLSKVLHAGDFYEVPLIPGLKLATGNAGGIEIVVNGRALPLLGPIGAVRRDVALDAASLLSKAGQSQ